MTDILFCLSSLLFLMWVIRLKTEIDELKHEITDLRDRVNRFNKKLTNTGRQKPAPQSAIWKGPALVSR